MPSSGCEGIQLGECAFAAFQILETQSVNVCCQVRELAYAIVSMAMERANEAREVKIASLRPEAALVGSCLEFTADVVSEREIFAERVKELLDNGQRVFRSTKYTVSAKRSRIARYSQFPTLHHICKQQCKTVTT